MMVAAFFANLLAAFVAILALMPMYIGIIREARKYGCKEIPDTVKSEWYIYILGCVLTAYFSFEFSSILSYYL